MIYLFYCLSGNELNNGYFNYLLSQLPFHIRTSVMRFRKWEDRQRSLLGKLLLTAGLKFLGLNSYSLDQLKFTEFQRPYFNNSFDFNISHSGDYIVCAICKTRRIGVDIEKVYDIRINDFEDVFSKKEIEEILKSENINRSFFNLWTQKESFLKAIGKGLQVPLNTISVNRNKIRWDNKNWYTHELKLDIKYVSCLCSEILSPEIVIEKIDFNNG